MKLSAYEFPLFLTQAKCDAFRRIEFTIRFKEVIDTQRCAKIKKLVPGYFKEEPLFAGRILNIGAGKILSRMNREDIKEMRKVKEGSSYTFYLKEFKDITTFDKDIGNWLEELNEICSIEFVLRDESDIGQYRYQGGNWTHVSDSVIFWHEESATYENIELLLHELEKDPKTYKQTGDEKRLFSYCIKAFLTSLAFKEDFFSLKKNSKLDDFIIGRSKLQTVFKKRDIKTLIKMIKENHSGHYIDTMIYEDMSDLFFMQYFGTHNANQDQIEFLLKLAKVLYSFENVWEICFPYGSSLAPLAKYAALNKDTVLLKKIAAHAQNDFRAENYVKEFGIQGLLLIKEKKYKEAIELFKLAISIDLKEKPVYPNYSVYCNALWVLLTENTGLPLNRELNVLFLKKCIKYAPQNPAIYCNAANIYAQMGEMEKAYKYFLLTKKHDPKNYSLMISEIKSIKVLGGFKDYLKNKRGLSL